MSEPSTRPSAAGAADPSKRALGVGLIVGLVAVLVILMVGPFPQRHAAGVDRVRHRVSPTPTPTRAPMILPASWSHRITFITDSVGLGAVTTLRSTEPGWIVRVRGRPAIMVHEALSDLRTAPIKIEKVVVVALGYNSLWQHARRDYGHWAGYFDDQVMSMLTYLHNHGARKIVWVTLRTPHVSSVPASAMWQYRAYAWYFPYVNQQLHVLDHRFRDLVLADWSAVSDRPGITYDAIHLNPTGAAIYARTVWHAVMRTPFGPGT